MAFVVRYLVLATLDRRNKVEELISVHLAEDDVSGLWIGFEWRYGDKLSALDPGDHGVAFGPTDNRLAVLQVLNMLRCPSHSQK